MSLICRKDPIIAKIGLRDKAKIYYYIAKFTSGKLLSTIYSIVTTVVPVGLTNNLIHFTIHIN